MKSPTVYAVYKKLKAINERKAAGLDKILCKRIAAEIVASSLTQIFGKTISIQASNSVQTGSWRELLQFLRKVKKKT